MFLISTKFRFKQPSKHREPNTMYVCICNNVTERDIEQAVRAGARSVDCLTRELGVSSCCGQCRCTADDVLNEALRAVIGRDHAFTSEFTSAS